jgi:putative membrane protein
MKLLLRWVIIAFSLFVAAWLVPGIRVEGNAWLIYAVMAVILGLVNAVVRPLLKLLTCGWLLVCFPGCAHCEHCINHPLGIYQGTR